MIVWLWDACGPDQNKRGVTDDGAKARQAAEECIRSGQATAARVEQAVSVLGVCTIATGYQRTGLGFSASNHNGQITWEPFSVYLPEAAPSTGRQHK